MSEYRNDFFQKTSGISAENIMDDLTQAALLIEAEIAFHNRLKKIDPFYDFLVFHAQREIFVMDDFFDLIVDRLDISDVQEERPEGKNHYHKSFELLILGSIYKIYCLVAIEDGGNAE